MGTKPEDTSGRGTLGLWAGLLAGGLIGWWLAVWLKRNLNQLAESGLAGNQLVRQLQKADEILTAWDIAVLPVLILIVLGTHEIGHVLSGLSQGMRFLLLIVGPFGWHASASGIRFEWNTNPALMGGLAAMLPTQEGVSLRRQLLVLIAGGPAASLLLAVVAIAVASVSDPRFAAYSIFIAATSFGIFLVTLIPVRAGGFMSDGLQFIDVLKGGSASIERSTLMQIFAQSLDGVRPRDWESSVIERLAKMDDREPLLRAGGLMYLLARAMDCQDKADIALYRGMLEDRVDAYPSGFKQAVHVELAVCAWLAGDTDAVERHLKASKGGIVEKTRRLLAEAAFAKLQGRDEDSERDRLRAISLLAKASDAGQSKLTKDQLAILQVGPLRGE
ncbi:MAG: hypothetical protein RL215_601 [Planctomycetota bacterium]